MLAFAKTYGAVLVFLTVIDVIWLGAVSGLYSRELVDIAKRKADGRFDVNFVAAAVVYVLLALGIVFLVLPGSTSLSDAAIRGAVMGLIVYGVYDMTNLALLKNWTWKISLLDMAWGAFSIGVGSTFGYWFKEWS